MRCGWVGLCFVDGWWSGLGAGHAVRAAGRGVVSRPRRAGLPLSAVGGGAGPVRLVLRPVVAGWVMRRGWGELCLTDGWRSGLGAGHAVYATGCRAASRQRRAEFLLPAVGGGRSGSTCAAAGCGGGRVKRRRWVELRFADGRWNSPSVGRGLPAEREVAVHTSSRGAVSRPRRAGLPLSAVGGGAGPVRPASRPVVAVAG
jgi:hypothetical protein